MQSAAPGAWLPAAGKPEEEGDCSPINIWFGGFHIPQTSSAHAPAAWRGTNNKQQDSLPEY
jgi:hypothetical protein